MELVQPGLGLIFWMTLSFLLLLFILRKFAWKPILKMLKEREEHIEESLQAADRAKEEMKKLKFSNEQLMKEAKEERDSILREARKIKEKLIDDAKQKANEEANRIVESAKERIENEKKAAMVDLKNEIAAISIEVAEKILRQELSDDKKQQAYLKKLIDDTKLN